MSEDVKMSMMPCARAWSRPNKKVDARRTARGVFIQAGRVVRLCQGRTAGDQRFSIHGASRPVASVGK